MSGYPPSIELARLFERTSARGIRYMLGRLGTARIVILPGQPTDNGTATWRLLVQERPEAAERPRRAIQDGAADRPSRMPPARQRRAPYRRPAGDNAAADGRPFDDEIPF